MLNTARIKPVKRWNFRKNSADYRIISRYTISLTIVRIVQSPILQPHRPCVYRLVLAAFRAAPLAAALLFTACAEPYIYPSNGDHALPKLGDTHALMEDGYQLPLRHWQAVGHNRAVVLALHGLNDYSFAFDNPGQYLAQHGISVIAYDQRGFGNTAGRGLWHGSERLVSDLATLVSLLRKQYPDTPLYLLGESMGGAVVLTSMASTSLDVDGVVLIAPAVWTRDNMPFYQRFGLWIAAHTLPGKQLTGKGLDLKPSDNIEMLRAFSRDEMVIKATRVDVLYGVSNLMDRAMLAPDAAPGKILLLYGEKDDIIPAQPTCKLLERLASNKSVQLTAIAYEQGYHMLTRDLQAEVVIDDIAAWIEQREAYSQSGHDMRNYCAEVIDREL